jgi:hypothetical protein
MLDMRPKFYFKPDDARAVHARFARINARAIRHVEEQLQAIRKSVRGQLRRPTSRSSPRPSRLPPGRTRAA